MKKLVAVALLSSLISASAFAAEGQAYIYGDYGSARFKDANPLPSPGMFDLGAGYQFHPNIAGELGYTYFGDSTADYVGYGTATAKVRSLHAAIVGIAPINNELSLFGKLGLASNKANLSSTGTVTLTKSSVSKTDTYFGLGVLYNLDKQVSMHVQYQNFGKFSSESVSGGTNLPSTSAISIGASYNF